MIRRIFAGLGAALFTAGVYSFLFGATVLTSPLNVQGLGPFNGEWNDAKYCFLGAILGSCGAGLLLGALLPGRPSPPRKRPKEQPPR